MFLPGNKEMKKLDEAGISKLDLKRCNRMQILKLLRQDGPTSRIDISRSLELTRAAVTIITNEMIESGILYKKGEVSTAGKKPTRGRKKVLIDINPNYKFTFGVVVDRGVVSVGLSNLNGEVLGKRSERLPDLFDVGRMLDSIINHVRDIKAESCLGSEQILGLGLCIPTRHFKELGVIQGDRQRMDFSALSEPLQKALGFPVVVEELVNSLALANIDFGYPEDKKPRNMVFVRYRKDITSSVIIDNQIYFGVHNRAAEFAHTVYDVQGDLCELCGQRGCVSTKISGAALTAQIDSIYSSELTPILYGALGETSIAPGQRALNEQQLFGDESIKRILSEASRYLAIAILNTVRMFDPEKIVFFGKMLENPALVDCVKQNLANYLDAETMGLLSVSKIKTKAIYLAGCSVAIRDLFIKKGAL